MYRNNPNKSAKPILKCQQQTCVKFKESLENINVLSEKSECTFIRSTTKILNLIKKPVTSHKEEKQENNVLTKEKENNAIVIKEDSSTDSNTMYI